jgi:hypothetical protein
MVFLSALADVLSKTNLKFWVFASPVALFAYASFWLLQGFETHRLEVLVFFWLGFNLLVFTSMVAKAGGTRQVAAQRRPLKLR